MAVQYAPAHAPDQLSMSPHETRKRRLIAVRGKALKELGVGQPLGFLGIDQATDVPQDRFRLGGGHDAVPLGRLVHR
jgi:hypothetical protein